MLFPGCPLVDGERDALKQQIRAGSDIVDIVGSYVSLRPTGGTYKGLCPFHEDSRPSFDVDPRRQRYRCWACNKFGDVFSFIQEIERISFPEALELLAKRAGISLEKRGNSQHAATRARMIEVMMWASEQFQTCLLDSPVAEAARTYLGERKLTGETVRRFGLGFAPAGWKWLVERAGQTGQSLEIMEQLGLIARRNDGSGYYDRFRDRVMFPIRDARGNTVGFGGRILPSSPQSADSPKYYNSSETMLFSKSENLYGIDQARQAAMKAGYVAVVEGYTDVLMAHQFGIHEVVATMGTALNERHVKQLRSVAPKVILVFDADAGGETGVDRALQVFVRHEMELQVATLPEGLDPCDLLVQRGADEFRFALTNAVDLLEFKLQQVWARVANAGIEGQRRALDEILTVLAQAPDGNSLKMELTLNRVAHRLGLKEEAVRNRLRELRAKAPPRESAGKQQPAGPRHSKAPAIEIELLEVLLADPALVPFAQTSLKAEEVEHPGLRLLLTSLYDLAAAGFTPDLDHLRERLQQNPRLLEKAFEFQDRGRQVKDRPAALQKILERFQQKVLTQRKQNLQRQLQAANAAKDYASAAVLLKKIQQCE